VSVTANTLGLSWDIEWFDTEIDNIVEHSHEKRIYKNKLILPKKTEIWDTSEKLNDTLLDFTKTKIILSGCDFLEDREKLEKKSFIHFPDFTEKDGISLE